MRADNFDPVYTLGVASKLSGVATHSIRQYIDKGLILPFRTETNRHLFSDVDIKRLVSIKKYIDDGLNIAGIKMLYAQIPGWLIKSCKIEDCQKCGAFNQSNIPCWEVLMNERKCNRDDCRNCEVYKMAEPVQDMKDYFLKHKSN